MEETIPETTNGRKAVLYGAMECVCTDRNQQYGEPEDNFATIAALWSTYLDVEINATDVAMMMCLLKIARVKSGDGGLDSFIDIAGYAACGGEVNNPITVVHRDAENMFIPPYSDEKGKMF